MWQNLFSQDNIEKVFRDKIQNRSGPGVDRITVERFEKELIFQAEIISRKCVAGTYQFSPYLEQLASKGKKSPPRVISIPTVRDKIVLKIITQYMHSCFENFISRDLPNTIVRKIKDQLCLANGLDFIRLDIKEFYDSIDHVILFAAISKTNNFAPFLRLLKRAVTNPTLSANYLAATRKESKNTGGVPQGLSISNILAEIYIAPFDASVRQHCSFYNRFVDDVLLFCSSESLTPIWAAISTNLADLKLAPNPQKSTAQGQSSSLDSAIDFLGYRFSQQRISVRDSSYQRYMHSILGKITKYKHGNAFKNIDGPDHKKAAFIQDLNERITGAIDESRRYGWVFFFSEISDLGLLHQMDRVICSAVQRLQQFSEADAQKIKSVTRTYFEAKHSPYNGYIHDYRKYRTIDDKFQYLLLVGSIQRDTNVQYSNKQIEQMFEQAKITNLLKLERDAGNLS